MENAIILVLLALAVAVGIWYTVRHFKGKGGCCGGGGYRPRKKKLSQVIGQKTFRVEEAVNDLHGVACRADWKKGLLTVSYAEAVENDRIKEKVERAGYHVTEIQP